MKFLLRVFTLIIPMLIAGCYFDNPLTKGPSKDVNTWLLGVWEHTDSNGRISRAIITPILSDRYALQVTLPGKKKRQVLKYEFEGWASRVGDTNFLTLRCLTSPGDIPTGGYMFVQIQLLDQNNFRVRGLRLDSPTSASSYQLRKEIRKKLKDRTLYSEETQDWKRVAEVFLSEDGRNPVFTPLRNPTF